MKSRENNRAGPPKMLRFDSRRKRVVVFRWLWLLNGLILRSGIVVWITCLLRL